MISTLTNQDMRCFQDIRLVVFAKPTHSRTQTHQHRRRLPSAQAASITVAWGKDARTARRELGVVTTPQTPLLLSPLPSTTPPIVADSRLALEVAGTIRAV